MGEKKLNKQTDGRTDGQMDRQTDSQANNNGLIGKSNKQYLRFFLIKNIYNKCDFFAIVFVKQYSKPINMSILNFTNIFLNICHKIRSI